MEERPWAEVAGALGLKEDAARKRVARALAALQGLLVTGLALVAWGWTSRRDEHHDLTHRLDALKAVACQVEAARMENARLKRAGVAPAELELLREDHAALPRLRREIQQLSREIDVIERSRNPAVR